MGILYGSAPWGSSMGIFCGDPPWGSSMGIFCEASMGTLYGRYSLGSSMGVIYGDPREHPLWEIVCWNLLRGSFMGILKDPLWVSSMRLLYGGALRGFSMRILLGDPLWEDPLWGFSMRILYGVLQGDLVCAIFFGIFYGGHLWRSS